MKHLSNLFKLLQLTRAQVQYGYLMSGMRKEQLSNLAEHHYLVTFIGWQLAKNLQAAGGKIDPYRVVEFCLIHDLGELMGGDISAWYAKINPKARRFAKAFEEENQKFFAKYFGNDAKEIKKMGKAVLDYTSDEALVAKVADYVEALSFKVYVGAFDEPSREFSQEKISGFIRKIKDKTAKKILQEFLIQWLKDVEKVDYIKILNQK